jgi:pyruvate dehydrogenase E1 component alpha subunit
MPSREIGPFNVTYYQVLDESGNVDEELEPELGEEQLVRLYRSMYLAREGDQRMLKLQRQGRVGTFGPSTGQEACVCAPVLAMTDKDWFVSAFREFGGYAARGVPLSRIYLYHNGYEEGNVADPPGRTLPISVPVSTQLLHAAGIGYAMKYLGEKDSAAVAFFGDGGTSQGEFHEALNFAAVWKSPAVFICQNNQWAISTPRSKQTASETLAQKAIAYNMPGVQVDGNDALAVYRAAKEALDRAHAGDGPTFIEAVTYRLMMHTTSDDPKKYRSEDDVQEWWKKEPLVRFKLYLEKKGIWNDDKQSSMESEVKEEINAAVKEFESMTGFKPDAPFDHVFGTSHDVIEEQRAEFLRNLRKESGNA